MMETEELRTKALNAAVAYLIVDRWAEKKKEPLQEIIGGLYEKYGGSATFNDFASEEDVKLMDKAWRKMGEYDKVVVEKREKAYRLACEYVKATEPNFKPYGSGDFIFGGGDGMLYLPADMDDADAYPMNYPLNFDGEADAHD